MCAKTQWMGFTKLESTYSFQTRMPALRIRCFQFVFLFLSEIIEIDSGNRWSFETINDILVLATFPFPFFKEVYEHCTNGKMEDDVGVFHLKSLKNQGWIVIIHITTKVIWCMRHATRSSYLNAPFFHSAVLRIPTAIAACKTFYSKPVSSDASTCVSACWGRYSGARVNLKACSVLSDSTESSRSKKDF